jgi:hypothetical protein
VQAEFFRVGRRKNFASVSRATHKCCAATFEKCTEAPQRTPFGIGNRVGSAYLKTT